MGRERQRYMSYLLRVWQVGSGSETAWRASVQNPHTGERTGFSSLEDLFAFLRQRTGAAADPDGVEGDIEGPGSGTQR